MKEEFLKQANLKFNNKFEYLYKEGKYIYFNCPDHGLNKQRDYHHLNSQFGCLKCSYEARSADKRTSITNRKKTYNEFLDQAKEVHRK